MGDKTFREATKGGGGHRYRIGLDPSFVEERPEFKKDRIHFYEWIMCENGGIIYLFDEKNMIFHVLTTSRTAEKILAQVPEAGIWLTQEDRLSREPHFPASVIEQVCELAGARRVAHRTEEQKESLRKRNLEKGVRPPGKTIPATDEERPEVGQ